MIKVSKKGETAKSKNYGRKKNDADFDSILVPEDNEIKNPNNSYSNKHQYNAPCSYSYKLIQVVDKCRKPFKSYLGEYFAHNFIIRMVKEINYCIHVMKKIV